MLRRSACLPGALLAVAAAAPALPAGLPAGVLQEVVVTARRDGLIGQVQSASEGLVLAEQLENRPILRPGEVLEIVPGMIVTQHSGDGKANQYFLRGFNLDHGTDFATRVDGVPVNMPTHAHGQGYTDINFVIPELIDSVAYRKGTYYAEEGNFSAAGAADMRYKRRLDEPLSLALSGGQDGYRRAFVAGSLPLAGRDLLIGADYSHNDGPWELAEGFRKIAGLAKFSGGDRDRGFSLTALGYDGRWRSTDQVPLRALEDGQIGRFGAMDPTDRGRTHRYSLSGEGWMPAGQGALRASAYAVDYALDLISNFTYATDPVNGDQFEQSDRRRVYGGEVGLQRALGLFGRDGTFKAGAQVRYDDISPVGLYRTRRAVRYETVREDDVKQGGYAAYLSQSLTLTPWLRADVGARFDSFHFDVKSNIAANSGRANDSIASPKVALVLGPWAKTEVFLNAGRGFHSNDARGTTITVDPNDGVTPVDRVTPLVAAKGAEIGFRTAAIPNVQLAGSLWRLDIDSELLFTGDGGTTEPSRATRRYGVELGAYYRPIDSLVIDADLAWSHARFTEFDPAGGRVPNAVESVTSVGVTWNRPQGFFGGARLRYFGPAPLIEDNSARSRSTMLVNLEGGYHVSRNLSFTVTVFNLLDRRANDITYYYDSQLAGELTPVGDYHFHPVEPRTVRAMVTMTF